MDAKRAQSIDKLNELLQKNIDAENTYRNAAKDVESPVLRNFFNFQAEKRAKFATELSTEILGFNGEPVNSESAKEKLHEVWVNLADVISGNNEESIIKGCLAADKANLKEYQEVLKMEDVHTNAKNLLEKQKLAIENTLSKIKNLEDVTAEFG